VHNQLRHTSVAAHCSCCSGRCSQAQEQRSPAEGLIEGLTGRFVVTDSDISNFEPPLLDRLTQVCCNLIACKKKWIGLDDKRKLKLK
jgi:hypothetical protein